MTQALELPSYREQIPEVAERFRRLRERPVVLEVKNLVKTFETAGSPVTALDRVSFEAYRREFLERMLAYQFVPAQTRDKRNVASVVTVILRIGH